MTSTGSRYPPSSSERRAQAEPAVVHEVRRCGLRQTVAAGADDRFDELLQRIIVPALRQLGAPDPTQAIRAIAAAVERY